MTTAFDRFCKYNFGKIVLVISLVVLLSEQAKAEVPIHYSAEAIGYASSYGEYAPYMMASNRHGTLSQSKGAQLRLSAFNFTDTTKRFSYGFGADFIAGASSATHYDYYNPDTDNNSIKRSVRPAHLFIQQLYGELKYRGFFITLGMKEYNSVIVNHELSSGDLLYSGNTRPIPEIRVGFIDFQNVPFTNGWVQVQAEYSFGKNMDNSWLENHFNYNGGWDDHITTDAFFSYKRFYFRTKPSQPFSLTIGLQAAMQTGGTVRHYVRGVVTDEYTDKLNFKKMLQTIVPTSSNEYGNYYKQGNSVGSWDVRGRWLFKNNAELCAYYQSPFEDGSGIGKLNGFDGLYGLEYKSDKPWYISSAVVEYFDFRNQSGPIHFDSDYNYESGQHRPGNATGKDDYYNNYQYSGYQYYGMSLGSPLLRSAFYNLNGSNFFLHNRVYGFHIGLAGFLYRGLQYRALLSWRTSLGTYDYPLTERQRSLSALLELQYDIAGVKGLRVKAQFAGDKGAIYHDNFGALVGLSYSGLFNIK